MGCKKLTYYESNTALGENWKIFVGGIEKSASGAKKCLNYYAGGMVMPNANNLNAASHTYGFNGMMRDNETKGNGNSYTSYWRQYDPRLGRWLSVDPERGNLTSWSPFSSFFNNPLYYSDELGNIPYPVLLKYIKYFDWGRQVGIDNNNQEYGQRYDSKGNMQYRSNGNPNYHYGIDFNVRHADEKGMDILNLADGKVIYAGLATGGGNSIMILHGNGYITEYLHMDKPTTFKAGDIVKEGQVIGKIGNTGGNYPVHGHLEIARIEGASKMSNSNLRQLFHSNKYHINPRTILGPNGGGDLQIIANGYIIGFNFKPTWEQLISGQIFKKSPVSPRVSNSPLKIPATPLEMSRMTAPMEKVVPLQPRMMGDDAVRTVRTVYSFTKGVEKAVKTMPKF